MRNENKNTKVNKKLSFAASFALILMLVVCNTVVGTVAFLMDSTNQVVNTFTPSFVDCEVNESFNPSTGVKSNVTVKNTGDTEAFIRVRLVSYRTKNINGTKETVGGDASVSFTPGSGWSKHGDCYYYNSPVAPGASTSALISSITLADYGDGETQTIEVMAEAIQSSPVSAAEEAWGWTPSSTNE